MGCVHKHRGIPTIEKWGSLSCVQSVVEKTGEDNRKARKIGWVINQTLTLRPENDKMQAWWASEIPLKSMLERLWWCKHFKMESWSWTICCPMNCSNARNTHGLGAIKDHHMSSWNVAKKKLLLLTHVNVSRRKGRWSTINLVTMIEMTKAQLWEIKSS
jgi:hypothetical protein